MFTEVRGLMNRKHVLEGQEQVQNALSDYCATVYPNIQVRLTLLDYFYVLIEIIIRSW